ncbi:hypothetical protein [Beijerinckia sp. L45]|uniref:hypothetical protein n=1 Tax=Beijerinckia sp. L45 TaxID=1641855 RepID=UPI00131BF03E|nr:hypothetical protein [Beijerinckia sp. L45]
MTIPRLNLRALAAALVVAAACLAIPASAAPRHHRPATTPKTSAHAPMTGRHHRVRHRHAGHRFYGYGSPDAAPYPLPAPQHTQAPSYCAGQFQDASPDGMFRDNVGRIRPCF